MLEFISVYHCSVFFKVQAGVKNKKHSTLFCMQMYVVKKQCLEMAFPLPINWCSSSLLEVCDNLTSPLCFLVIIEYSEMRFVDSKNCKIFQTTNRKSVIHHLASYWTGHPWTSIPFAVGQDANSQCSPFVPHQITPFFSNPTERYNNTAMNATPASKAAERM